jgi:hypothetical protein
MSRNLASVTLRDVIANRPAPGLTGREFYASDTLAGYRDNGASWDQFIFPGVHKFSLAIVAQTAQTVTHNLGTLDVIVQVRDSAGKRIEPETEAATDVNTVNLTFGAAFTGRAIVIG